MTTGAGTRATDYAAIADTLAKRLTVPPVLPAAQQWFGPALWKGLAGTALLHVERAHVGAGSWRTAHAWVNAATSPEISAAEHSGLHTGVTAIAFLLQAADADGADRYAGPRAAVDARVTALAHRRVDIALARMRRGTPVAFAEYDVLHGLTGIGAHLLHNSPTSDALPRILEYLVSLTHPVRHAGEWLPGWFAHHSPEPDQPQLDTAGHLNLGMAHGIAGPLALLAHSLRRGISVDGHIAAIETVCAWLDRWRQHHNTGSQWPQWLSRSEMQRQHRSPALSGRPSWCYGAPGLARAQQLAALATGDTARQQMAEAAIAAALVDSAKLSDAGLCHGLAGLHQTGWRAATDAASPEIGAPLPAVADQLAHQMQGHPHPDRSLLDGTTGAALVLHTAARQTPPIGGWDTCLLIA